MSSPRWYPPSNRRPPSSSNSAPPEWSSWPKSIRYARQKGLLVILDGKRNDIGSTATAYAKDSRAPQSPWGADALTVSPYLGDDSLQPFVDAATRRAAGVFVLVKTSNPGGRMSRISGRRRPLYRHVAQYVEQLAAATAGRAATERSGRWSAPPIPRNWPSFARCRTPGSWCPASAARAARRPTWPRRSIRRASGRSSTIPGHHLRPYAAARTPSVPGPPGGKRPSRRQLAK